jgi:polysaccharide deacetylase 2 family uncharacterized protein YibQ
MRGRTRFDAAIDKQDALTAAEKAGEVADSLDVRMALIKRMHSGELTLPDVQRELERIKRDAKKNGKLTRSQVWRKS